MKERPILFSGPMVRAILDGRKTQTRRVVKPPKPCFILDPPLYYTTCRPVLAASPGAVWWHGEYERVGTIQECPYGQPGNRLWVRETCFDAQPYMHAPLFAGGPRWIYAADDAFIGCHRWRPSIHMPRWASRITLEIVSVRVERLNDISQTDAQAEGVAPLFTEDEIKGRAEFAACRGMWKNYLWHGHHGKFGMGNAKSDAWAHQSSGYDDARGSFSSLWESINGPGSWDANPWVWVVEFRRVEPAA